MRDGDLLVGWGMATATYPAHKMSAAAKGILAAEKPDVVVVMLGFNDRIPMRDTKAEGKPVDRKKDVSVKPEGKAVDGKAGESPDVTTKPSDASARPGSSVNAVSFLMLCNPEFGPYWPKSEARSTTSAPAATVSRWGPGRSPVSCVHRAGWPDPRSRFQPDGVLGASECVDPNTYRWRTTDWVRPAWSGQVTYELHIGTFTDAGTFLAAIEKLDYLRDLGIEAIEIMPIGD